MELSPGKRLGAYEIGAPIGAGGMGEVYRARDTRLGRDVALKLLADSVSTDAERRARFDREARTLASLNHPGIVTIFAVEKEGDHHFIAMELVEGRPLSELITRNGLKLDRLLNVAAQIAGAVAAAHHHGIVHRDLKPANVMIGPQDRVKVLDFGLAKLRAVVGDGETLLPTKEITGQGRILGTVSYMSPEQAEGRPVDHRSDVFSMGVLLYEMATGERPFKGDTSMSVLSAILKDSPKPITDLAPALPRELGRILKRCLAKDPDERYQSAADLRNDIEDLRQSTISGELHSSSGSPATAGHRRRGGMIAAGVAGLALVGAGWAIGRTAEPGVTTPELKFSRLTLLDGVTSEPMISPDGKWVAYVSAIGGNPDIFLQSTSGQTPINLTKDSTASDTSPAFSPDGEFIAFRSERDGGGLFVMGRTGESVRRLTKVGYQPAWFPDGRQLVFVSRAVGDPEGRPGEISDLWIVATAGGEPRRLMMTDAVQPRVSPNGQRIAYWAMPIDPERTRFVDANRDLWTVAADGSTPVRVTTEATTESNPVWSPDGRWLYFLSNRSGSANLWRVAIDESTGVISGAPQPLTVPAPYIRNISLSADGRLLGYATASRTNNLARIAFDARAGSTTGAVQPITTGPRDFTAFDVTREHKVVVGTSPRLQEDLFVVDGTGAGMRNVTNDAARDRNPRWSADGRQIFFYSDRGKNYEAWSVDGDGGSLRQITESDGRRYYPVPSRDGTRLVTADINTRQMYAYDTRDYSKPPESLPPLPDELRRGNILLPTDWSPDGKLLSGSNGVLAWVYSFDTHQYRSVASMNGATVQFLPDGRRLLLSRQGRLIIVDIDTRAEREVLAIPGETIGNARFSPDWSYLYFLHGDQSGDVWLARFDDASAATSTVRR